MKPLTDDQYVRIYRIRAWAQREALDSLAEACTRLLWAGVKTPSLAQKCLHFVRSLINP